MSPRAPSLRPCIRLAIFVFLRRSHHRVRAYERRCRRRPPPPGDVEALIEPGCFRCLELALARAGERRQTPLAFEAAVLLALRATERGMPSEEWIARARTYADRNPERAEYLEWRWRCRRIHSAGCVMICSSRRNFAPDSAAAGERGLLARSAGVRRRGLRARSLRAARSRIAEPG